MTRSRKLSVPFFRPRGFPGAVLYLSLFLVLISQAGCAFLGIPSSREYSADQARTILNSALEESILLAALLGSDDEGDGARIVQNLLLQSRAFEFGVPIESGKVYLREDVHGCADRLRSVGVLIGVATTPEAVVLPAVDCDIPAQ